MTQHMQFNAKSNGTGLTVDWDPEKGLFIFHVAILTATGIQSVSCYLYPQHANDLGNFLLLVKANTKTEEQEEETDELFTEFSTLEHKFDAFKKDVDKGFEVLKKDVDRALAKMVSDVQDMQGHRRHLDSMFSSMVARLDSFISGNKPETPAPVKKERKPRGWSGKAD